MGQRSYGMLGLILAFAFVPWASGQTTNVKAELPKVVLIGDSIRLGYAPRVAEQLAGKATVLHSKDNGGDSSRVLKNVDAWVVAEQPDVVHINCGLHDLKKMKADGSYQVPLDAYINNLREIVSKIRSQTKAAIVFANTTPILDDRHAKRKADFDRFEADVVRYNKAALGLMNELNIPVDDLHWVVEDAGAETMLGPDGTHYTPAGYDRLAEAVTDCVLRQLTILRDVRSAKPTPISDAKSGEAYRKAEAERDAQVPDFYKKMHVPELPIPRDRAEWQANRPNVLNLVKKSLGDLPPRPASVKSRVVSRELRPGYTLEKVDIDNGAGGYVSALYLKPEVKTGPIPAILWLHSSTPDKTQILVPNTNGGERPIGEVYVRNGFAVLSPDAYWHGDRVGTGPSGPIETGLTEQTDLHKYNLWHGRTLWGMFVRDDQVALDYLCTRPGVDVKRIGTTGMSMGSTRAWWLAAVDERINTVVAVACLTRYQELIAHGNLKAHGVYYFVDGLLKHFDTEGVLALIAPRPFLVLTGDLDYGSPADGIRHLEQIVGKVYESQGAGDHFRNVLYPDVGHTVTPKMREETLAWFKKWLNP